jgi:DNA-binding response OmpR family regulator
VKILIIDDDASFRQTLARILVNDGYEVVMADDGEHGLAMFYKDRPDLVICDLIMPHRNGIDTIAQIRRESQAMKIIAVSGGGRGGQTMNADGLATALEYGANEVIIKPISNEDLLSRVRNILAG